jgi:hypothetical protein
MAQWRLLCDKKKGDKEDRYYFLPKTNVKLWSKAEYKRYKECLDSVDGLEHLALPEFWRMERERERVRQIKDSVLDSRGIHKSILMSTLN